MALQDVSLSVDSISADTVQIRINGEVYAFPKATVQQWASGGTGLAGAVQYIIRRAIVDLQANGIALNNVAAINAYLAGKTFKV